MRTRIKIALDDLDVARRGTDTQWRAAMHELRNALQAGQLTFSELAQAVGRCSLTHSKGLYHVAYIHRDGHDVAVSGDDMNAALCAAVQEAM